MDISTIDIILIPISYIYIFTVIGIASKLKRSEKITGTSARKLIHIGVGSIIITIPILFSSKIIPTLIGLSFILITYITSPVSPFSNLKLSAFKDGHGLGTVYYAISLTLILFLFFNEGWIVQAGFLPLVFGDATASLVGIRYGKHKWKLIPKKSVEGSIAGFISTFIILIIVLNLYSLINRFDKSFQFIFLLSMTFALVMTLVELTSPLGLDNITIPLVCTSIALIL